MLKSVLSQGIDFPGGKVTFTSNMEFIPGNSDRRVLCYQVLNQYGHLLNDGYFEQVQGFQKF